jgi:hypothetical protein
MADSIKEFTVRMSADDHRALRVFASLTERSMNDIVVSAVREYLTGAGRQEALDAAVLRVQSDYREALDKLSR